MRKHLTRSEIQKLAKKHGLNAVSIYAPLRPEKGNNITSEKALIRSLLNDARVQLYDDLSDKKAHDIMQKLEKLINDNSFWQDRSYGVAMFASETEMHWYPLMDEVEPRVVVDERYFLLPLMSHISDDGRFYVLALSRGSVRFLKASKFDVKRLSPAGLPENLEVTMIAEASMDRMKKAGGHRPGRGTPDGKQEKIKLETYCRYIDKVLQPTLNKDRLPLVVIGLPTIQSIYREVSSYHNIISEPIHTNPDTLSDQELKDKAWNTIAPLFGERKESAISRLAQIAHNSPSKVIHGIRDILEAARTGRVEAIYIGENDSHQNETNTVMDEALLNRAASEALEHKGDVYTVDVKNPELNDQNDKVTAVLRY